MSDFPRVRTKDSHESQDGMVDVIPAYSQLVTHDIILCVSPLSTVKTMRDGFTPGAKRLMANGQVVQHPCHLDVLTRGGGNMEMTLGVYPLERYHYHGNFRRLLWDYCPTAGFEGYPGVERLKNDLIIRAFAKMKTAPVMGGEVLRDFTKTVQMLQHPFRSALEICQLIGNKAKKRRRKGRVAYEQALASAWLEYRYAMMPTVLDAREIIRKSMTIRDKGYGPTLVARASAAMEQTAKSAWSDQVWIGNAVGPPFNCVASSSGSSHLQIDVGVRYRFLPESTMEKAVRQMGLQLCDAVPTLWEWTPLSFVGDWFSNVGDWLNATKSMPSLQILNSWLSTQENKTVYKNATVLAHYNNQLTKADVATMWETNFSYSRVIGVGPPAFPSLTGVKLSGTHKIDALALMTRQISNAVQKLL